MGILKDVRDAYAVIKKRDPAIHSIWEVFLYPTFQVMRSYRRAHRAYERGHFFWARLISQRAARRTNIEIHPGAKIGRDFFIDHGTGVIIGETAVIGDNVLLYQGVTLGGTGKETGKRHPTIGDNVMISAGAKVLGSITVGNNSKIGAGSVVIEDVPENCTVVGVPGRIVRRNNQKICSEELDQTDLPDPVREDLRVLQRENSALVNRVIDLEQESRVLAENLKRVAGHLERREAEIKEAARRSREEWDQEFSDGLGI